jgi:hypothetical protein
MSTRVIGRKAEHQATLFAESCRMNGFDSSSSTPSDGRSWHRWLNVCIILLFNTVHMINGDGPMYFMYWTANARCFTLILKIGYRFACKLCSNNTLHNLNLSNPMSQKSAFNLGFPKPNHCLMFRSLLLSKS